MCVSPLKGFRIGVNPSGKPSYKITSYKVHHMEYSHGNWIKCLDRFQSPTAEKIVIEFQDIPCGHCIECRLNYAKTWANRVLMESQKYDSNYFLTLTYDDSHLFCTGDGLMSLNSLDLRDFWKRLRKRVAPEQLRYFACGEYGDTTKRPHYHAIVFNLKIPDLQFHGKSESGALLFVSDWLNSIWKQGYVVIGEVTSESASYVARYTMKKAKGIGREYYEALGIEPEFIRMSRRPGIGSDYFDENFRKIYDNDELILSSSSGAVVSKPPKYFDDKLELIDKEWYDSIKAKRLYIAENRKKLIEKLSGESFEKQLEKKGNILEKKVLALKRQI